MKGTGFESTMYSLYQTFKQTVVELSYLVINPLTDLVLQTDAETLYLKSKIFLLAFSIVNFL